MNTKSTIANCLRAGAVFGGCLLMALLLPLVGFALNSNILFFAPQYLFPYSGFVVHQAFGSRAVFSHCTAVVLVFVQWGLAAAGFAWFARRISTRGAVLGASGTILLIAIAVNLAFGLFGITVELDGP